MSRPLPWYKEGLRFSCTECGKCCTGAPGAVWLNEEEAQKIAAYLNLPPDRFLRRIDGRLSLKERRGKEGHDCIFLKGKRCTVYPVRPKQCRTFPWWPQNLKSKEAWKRAAGECEGISDGAPLVPYEKIKENLDEHCS